MKQTKKVNPALEEPWICEVEASITELGKECSCSCNDCLEVEALKDVRAKQGEPEPVGEVRDGWGP